MRKKIVNRLEKLEKVFARVAASATIWGSIAKFRDRLLQLAEHRAHRPLLRSWKS